MADYKEIEKKIDELQNHIKEMSRTVADLRAEFFFLKIQEREKGAESDE